MKVKTLRAHQNQFGTKYAKAKGDEYEHPDPATDIKFDYVEPVETASAAGGDSGDQKAKGAGGRKTSA